MELLLLLAALNLVTASTGTLDSFFGCSHCDSRSNQVGCGKKIGGFVYEGGHLVVKTKRSVLGAGVGRVRNGGGAKLG